MTKAQEYAQHPVAIKLMPGGMTDEEFDALCDDVKERGLIYPITLFETKVLDGWHRYRACQKTKTEPTFIEYKGKDPAGYVAACNIMRRKLGSIQRAYVAARIHLDHSVTQRDVCKRYGISNQTLTYVLDAIKTGNAKLIKRIENDSDLSREALLEELHNIGADNQKARNPPPPPPVLSAAASDPFRGMAQSLASSDTSGITADEEEEDEHLPEVGKKNPHLERKPKASAAHKLSLEFKELMRDEQITFMQMVWPIVKKFKRTPDMLDKLFSVQPKPTKAPKPQKGIPPKSKLPRSKKV